MEWVGLVVWLVVLACALPVAAAAGLSIPSLGAQSLVALAGFVFCVLYIAIGEGRWMAWTSFGLALAAAFVLALGAARLVVDDPQSGRGASPGEELASPFVGFELPLLLTAAFVMLLAAVGVTLVD